MIFHMEGKKEVGRMKLKHNMDGSPDRSALRSRMARFTAAAVAASAVFVASPEHFINNGAPIPTAFTI